MRGAAAGVGFQKHVKKLDVHAENDRNGARVSHDSTARSQGCKGWRDSRLLARRWPESRSTLIRPGPVSRSRDGYRHTSLMTLTSGRTRAQQMCSCAGLERWPLG